MKEPDGGQQFNQFAFIKVLAQIGPERIVNVVSIAGHALCQPQCGLFPVSEIGAGFKVMQVIDLIF